MSARAGDRNELENLLKKTTPDLRRFAHQVCRTGADAEDAVQHVLVNVSLRVDGLEGIQRFTSWAFAVIRNECTRALSVATKWLRSTPPEPEAAPDPHRQAESRELLELVVEAIRELPAPLREVLVLRELEGVDTASCADQLGLSEANVKVRLHRARSLLRERLVKSSIEL
jgi:RNA polymerase sigma factor (sigma-70 family)